MKKLISACWMLLASALASAQGYDPVVSQYDPTASYVHQYSIPKPAGGGNGILMYDGTAKLQFLASLDAKLVLSGTTLTLDLSAYTTSATLSSTLASYATSSALTSGLAGKFNVPTCLTSQYLRGDGSCATLPAGGSGTVTSVGITSSTLSVVGSPVTTSGSISVELPTRVVANAARALSTCFQISATRDALVSYGVDITTTLTLASTSRGSAYLRTYTNSGCSAGQVTVIGSTSGMPTTLSVTVGQQVIGTASLYGFVTRGLWARIETAVDAGTGGAVPAFSIRTEQQEVQL